MASRDRDRKKFKFRETSEKTVKERSSNTGNFDRYIKSKYPSFKVRDGENTLRIMPRTWDDVEQWGDNWGIPIALHYGIGPDKGAYLCNKVRGKSCYLCEERAQLAKDGEEEAADALRPSARIVAWVVDRDAEKEGPQIYPMPATKIEVEVQLLSKDDDGSVLQITNPDEGYDVVFTKTGSQLKTDYKGVRLARKPSPLHDKESKQDEWLDFVEANPLPDVLNFYDNDYLEQVYGGKSAKRKDEDEDEEDTKDKGRSSKRGRDEEEEDEPEPDRDRGGRSGSRGEARGSERRSARKDEEEDAEDEPPKRTRRSRDDAEEDEDKPKRRSVREPEPEEDEDDKPKKRDRSAEAKESVERLKDRQKKRAADEDEDEEEDEKPKRSRRSRDEDDD